MAIAWKRSLHQAVQVDTASSHRVVGILLPCRPHPLCILSVYLPSRSGCTDIFKESLDYIDSLFNLLNSEYDFIILGDINADPGPQGGPKSSTPVNEQGRILNRYLSKWNFVSAHLHKSPSLLSHTYVSEAHGSFSTLDHILCSRHFLPAISQCAVLEETPLNTSDHLPLSCRISATPLSSPPSATSPSVIPPRSNWKKASP